MLISSRQVIDTEFEKYNATYAKLNVFAFVPYHSVRFVTHHYFDHFNPYFTSYHMKWIILLLFYTFRNYMSFKDCLSAIVFVRLSRRGINLTCPFYLTFYRLKLL